MNAHAESILLAIKQATRTHLCPYCIERQIGLNNWRRHMNATHPDQPYVPFPGSNNPLVIAGGSVVPRGASIDSTDSVTDGAPGRVTKARAPRVNWTVEELRVLKRVKAQYKRPNGNVDWKRAAQENGPEIAMLLQRHKLWAIRNTASYVKMNKVDLRTRKYMHLRAPVNAAIDGADSARDAAPAGGRELGPDEIVVNTKELGKEPYWFPAGTDKPVRFWYPTYCPNCAHAIEPHVFACNFVNKKTDETA